MKGNSKTSLDLWLLLDVSIWGLCLKEIGLNPYGPLIIFNRRGPFPSVSATFADLLLQRRKGMLFGGLLHDFEYSHAYVYIYIIYIYMCV